MKRILLLIEHRENQRLLAEWLSQYYEIILGDDLNHDFDLGIVDGPSLKRLWQDVKTRKDSEYPVFLPVILITPRQDIGLITNNLWQSIDDLINSPVEKAELGVRIQLLLRTREMSLELRETNRELTREIEERLQVEHRLRRALDSIHNIYTISRSIGGMQTSHDVLNALLVDRYREHIRQASISIFNTAWQENPPRDYQILAVLRPELPWPGKINTFHPLDKHPFYALLTPHNAVLIGNVQADERLNPAARHVLTSIDTRSAMIFPLKAGGLWYGFLSIYSDIPNRWTEEDAETIGTLVEQVAVTINNIYLFDSEARARQEAEKANQLKLQFIAMISHELRTPLTSIKGFATTLLAKDITWDAESQEGFIQIINEEADKLGELVEQLLDLTQLKAGSLRIVVQPTDMQYIMSLAIAQLEAITAEHQFVMDIPHDLPDVLVDARRAAQVMVNLVSNAARYSAAGSRIELSVIQIPLYLQINVSDEGIGIPREAHDSIFEPFQQAGSSTNHQKGVGLGLAICKGIVEAHRGQIWIQDREGPGTTISFTIPILGAATVS